MKSVETPKNIAVIEADRVVKTFKRSAKAVARFRREVESLRRLEGIEGIPALLEVSEPQLRLVMSRLPGDPISASRPIADAVFVRLRQLVAVMMERGVARHSIPPRDVIVGPGGEVGLVDFERVTLRGGRYDPLWRGACAITRFHLLRLIGDEAPHLLSASEARTLGVQRRLGDVYHALILFRRRLRGGRPPGARRRER